MDQKTRDLLKKKYPKHKVVEPAAESRYAVDADADDVDVKGLSPEKWKKFGTPPKKRPAGSSATHSDDRSERSKESPSSLRYSGDVLEASKGKESDDLRERFRPRRLTGAGRRRPGPAVADPAKTSSRTPGKLTVERLVPEDAPPDSDTAIDVLVDEEDGPIGESDSGPESD